MPQDFQADWVWSLGDGSDNAVAIVNSDGIVTGLKQGKVNVTATRDFGQESVSFSQEVEVTKLSLAKAQVTIPRQTYSGKKLTPVPVVTLDETTLVFGTDYEVVDQDIVSAGIHNVTIQGKGTYEGKATGTFVVEPLRLKRPEATTDIVYNGLPHTGVPEGADYSLKGNVTETDADVYLVTAVVKDKVNTCWDDNSTSCRIEWSIKPRSASEVNVTVSGSCVYNGSAQKPKPTVTWSGKALRTDEDYTVSYANNVNAGIATVIVTCKDGNFTGTKTATFNIAPAPYSPGVVTAAIVKDSLDPADVVLTRADTTLPGRLAISETKLAYGANTYHWTFTPADANHEPSSGTVEITVTGHEWSKPTYEWAEDNTSCTARRVCANNASHVEEETVTPTRKVTVEPSIDSEGKAALTSEFKNAAFEKQTKEITLPKLAKTGKVGASVAMQGDGPVVEMNVSKGLVESLLTDKERELVAAGADASLVARVRWLDTGETPEDDLALLAKDCEDKKASMGWEAYLDVRLSLRVGDAEREIAKTNKPVVFMVELDAEAEDAVSKGLAQAINDDKVDGSIIVRRVHEGSVDEIGSAKSGEAITFESDRFSIYALGSKAKSTSNAVGNRDDSSDESKDKEDSKDGQSQGSDQTTANRTQTTGVTTGSQAAGSSTKLADTSDSESPVIVLPILGLVVCGLGVAGRRRSTART